MYIPYVIELGDRGREHNLPNEVKYVDAPRPGYANGACLKCGSGVSRFLGCSQSDDIPSRYHPQKCRWMMKRRRSLLFRLHLHLHRCIPSFKYSRSIHFNSLEILLPFQEASSPTPPLRWCDCITTEQCEHSSHVPLSRPSVAIHLDIRFYVCQLYHPVRRQET